MPHTSYTAWSSGDSAFESQFGRQVKESTYEYVRKVVGKHLGLRCVFESSQNSFITSNNCWNNPGLRSAYSHFPGPTDTDKNRLLFKIL